LSAAYLTLGGENPTEVNVGWIWQLLVAPTIARLCGDSAKIVLYARLCAGINCEGGLLLACGNLTLITPLASLAMPPASFGKRVVVKNTLLPT
jgi:hypothetical protein